MNPIMHDPAPHPGRDDLQAAIDRLNADVRRLRDGTAELLREVDGDTAKDGTR